MRLFVSYRREDSGYLAAALHEGLRAQGATTEVFVDTRSLSLGVDFVQEVGERIARCDAVLALVGQSWKPERLRAERDYVRDELVAARRHDVLVMPALHSGTQPLAKQDLPSELAWLARLNAFRFGDPGDLEHDVVRLHAALTGRGPVLQALRDRAWELYESGAYDALLDVVEEAWARDADRPSPALAEVCRTVAIATVASDAPRRDLWSARALSTAFRAGAATSFAAAMLPHFFRQVGEGDGPAARLVLDEIERVASVHDVSQLPSVGMVRRIVAEKRAFSLAGDGLFAEAAVHYGVAIAAAQGDGDERGALKCRGGRALVTAVADPDSAGRELRLIETSARTLGFADVRRIASDNLRRLEAGVASWAELAPFEVV